MHLHFSNDGFDPYNPKKQENNRQWIGAAIGAAASLASNAVNYFSQKKANKENAAFAQEQFDYQKQLNALTMQRQDSAFQRAVEDAQKAGLSPLVAAGAPAQSGGVSSTQMSLGQVAPQVEANTFGDMMRVLSQEAMQERQIKASSESQEDQQDFEMLKQSAALDAQDAMLDKQLKQASEIENKKLKEQEMQRIQQKKIFNATQRNIYEAKNQEERMAASSEARKAAAAIGVKNFEPFTDWSKYQEALKARSAGAQTRASASWAMTSGYDETTTNGGSSSFNSSLEAKAGVSGVGASSSLSGSESGNSSQTMHSSAVQMMNQAEVEYWNKTGYPVYVGEHHHEDI